MTVRGMLARVRGELHAATRERAMTRAADRLRGAVALEPGGPSQLFERLGAFPVYRRLAALDTLDYAERTLWSGSGSGGVRPRRRLIGEAARLQGIAQGSYDALLASHVIEHLANPLGALAAWRAAVRPGGHIVLIVPHRDGTFDHRRPVTSLAHLRADAERSTGEDDLGHLQEVLALHDLERDPGAPSRSEFERRCRENHSTRAMHHHVFTTLTVFETVRAAGLGVLLLRPMLPYNIVCVCTLGAQHDGPERPLARILRDSPFHSDRSDADRLPVA